MPEPISPFALLCRWTFLSGLFLALGAPWAAAQDRPTIFAVNYALSYFAERLGGSEVEVVFPVPDGIDPAFWRPDASEISRMQAADLIVLNGAGFAGWTTQVSLPRSRLVDTSRGFRDRYIATQSVTHSHGNDGAHSHTAIAAFTWLDQELAVLQAQAIAAAMASRGLLDPDLIYQRLTGLSEDLMALDALAQTLRTDAEGVALVATHPRYQYLARAYDLDIRSLEWEAGAAPDNDQLEELAALHAETDARLLLWEAPPPEAARADVTALGLVDVVFPTLAMTPPEADYISVLTEALETLKATLKVLDG